MTAIFTGLGSGLERGSANILGVQARSVASPASRSRFSYTPARCYGPARSLKTEHRPPATPPALAGFCASWPASTRYSLPLDVLHQLAQCATEARKVKKRAI